MSILLSATPDLACNTRLPAGDISDSPRFIRLRPLLRLLDTTTPAISTVPYREERQDRDTTYFDRQGALAVLHSQGMIFYEHARNPKLHLSFFLYA